ncbi:MAG: hypothetical protein R3C41_22930, partial [Calditrichia bacterium]
MFFLPAQNKVVYICPFVLTLRQRSGRRTKGRKSQGDFTQAYALPALAWVMPFRGIKLAFRARTIFLPDASLQEKGRGFCWLSLFLFGSG